MWKFISRKMTNINKFILNTNIPQILNQINSNSFIMNLPISIERLYHNGNLFIDFIDFLKSNIVNNSDYNIIKIQLDVGDILNRHNWYYRYCEKYMLENDLTEEEQIPLDIREKFKKDSYQEGKKQGEKWFKNNLEAINQLIPNKYQLNKNFKLNDGLTVLYKGDKNNPEIEYISYSYWLEHPRYYLTEKALKRICNLKSSSIDRAFTKEAEYFYDILKKNKNIKYKEFFIKICKKYLIDESIAVAINHSNDNVIEFYPGVWNLFSQYFKGRKAQNNPIIKKLMEKGGALEGADKRKFVSVKVVKEKENSNE
jgi:hypothetical protein